MLHKNQRNRLPDRLHNAKELRWVVEHEKLALRWYGSNGKEYVLQYNITALADQALADQALARQKRAVPAKAQSYGMPQARLQRVATLLRDSLAESWLPGRWLHSQRIDPGCNSDISSFNFGW